MQYHLDTIPVWEAMEQHTDCPLCALFQKLEQTEIERSLGGSVMEPEARIRVNETGICQKHHKQLSLQKNKLGHALLMDSHTKEILQKIKGLSPAPHGPRSLFGGRKASSLEGLAQILDTLTGSCVICEALETHMNRFAHTFVHLWKREAKFRKVWEESRGVCLPHAALLLRHGERQLLAEQRQAFSASLLSLLEATLKEDEKDLEWFTLKFDYRNQSKPWGNSKNALERTVNRLRGRCLSQHEE